MFFIPVLTMSTVAAAGTGARGVRPLGAGAVGVTAGGLTVVAGLAGETGATESGFTGVAAVGGGIESPVLAQPAPTNPIPAFARLVCRNIDGASAES